MSPTQESQNVGNTFHFFPPSLRKSRALGLFHHCTEPMPAGERAIKSNVQRLAVPVPLGGSSWLCIHLVWCKFLTASRRSPMVLFCAMYLASNPVCLGQGAAMGSGVSYPTIFPISLLFLCLKSAILVLCLKT
jgi:hypothetical protein